jgi:hypothetical protein
MMQTTIIKADDELREFTAVAYRANAGPDAQGDTMDAHDLQVAVAHFASEPRIALEHEGEPLPDGTVTVLSTYMTAQRFGKLPKDAWIIHAKVSRDKSGDIVWARIKGGKAGDKFIELDGRKYPTLTGLSMGGVASREAVS